MHDSIVAKFHKSKEEEFKKLAIQALTTDVYNFLRNIYGYEFKTSLGVGIKCSTHWGDTKDEVKYNVTPTGEIYEKPAEED